MSELHAHPRANLSPATIDTGIGIGKTTLKVLVDEATGVHYCADCLAPAASYSKVRVHRRYTHGKGAGARTKKAPAAPADQIGALIESLTKIQAEQTGPAADLVPAEWKTRALSAERQLKSLRRILGGGAA